MNGSTEIHENLPLTEATFLIMLSISAEPRHGYAIMKDVQDLSDGRVNLSTGTMYGAIKRLLEGEWIERVDDPSSEDDADQSTRFRKAYRLTHLGRQVLVAEMSRMRTLLNVARERAQGAPA